ncbi:MAG: UDP-N-acetylmuramoyl-L-alanyl-D-glutamate--2,6-diaminopimelate ligase [Motiliproteus sp.]|nr:UDP-N-acetylmuramoyl-L-alanyl-D-glutamate--2,6-diaminopimelate ligase [Motiliproteus sp.]MCW9051697.1 UDP-N-acetylmuramoyl-L-alanyl-D-glutamate--2,6-diaminopimelate ligase [Motiliproteus sp.]
MSITGPQMTLEQLLPQSADQLRALGCQQVMISGITLDSRQVQAGDLFLACQGELANGIDFIGKAEAQGAVAVLVNSEQQISETFGLPVIALENLEQRLPELGSRFYSQPSQQLHMVGITGTNGKTSCSHFIAQALQILNNSTAVIGTNGYGFLGDLKRASHTTPDALYLQGLLSQVQQQGAETVVMEVSSHALDQGRVNGVDFDVAVFTNLTRDHLDYHGDMASYGAAKTRLFRDFGISQAIVNLDDPFSRELLEQMPPEVEVIGYSQQPLSGASGECCSGQVWVEDCCLSLAGTDVTLQTPVGTVSFSAPILGQFNLHNLMVTVAVLLTKGFGSTEISAAMAKLQGVEGRMQPIAVDVSDKLVVVDYAHTPDALEKALQALRSHCHGQLWCLFGCGGDRDRGKRAQMAQVAEAQADRVMVTSDNPRSEAPQAIIKDIRQGFSVKKPVLVEVDRRAAIEQVLRSAQPGDVVLVAGKGHEDYQEIEGVRHPFSDAEVICSLLHTDRGEQQ